jgi:hypothetical protein
VSPAEQTAIRRLQDEMIDRLDNQDKAIAGLRAEVQPAIAFYQSVVRIGEAIADAARFVKWAVGLGAGAATIFGVLRVFAIL